MPRPPRRTEDALHAPSDLLWATDLGRAFGEYGLLSLTLGPLLFAAPRGDRHPVLVLPGLLASDTSTLTLRTYLSYLGYDVAGWELGRNVGPTPTVVDGLLARLDALVGRRGLPASVIGWSLGGIFARELARQRPESVRQVVTLGSPFRMEHPDQAPAYRTYEVFAHLHVAPDELPPPERTRPPLPCPTTAVYSRWDGLVSWKTCVEEPGAGRENVAVWSSHLGYGHHPAVLWLVADRLRQAEGGWTPFRPPPLLRPLYPTNGNGAGPS